MRPPLLAVAVVRARRRAAERLRTVLIIMLRLTKTMRRVMRARAE
jgi:hypothetical protein